MSSISNLGGRESLEIAVITRVTHTNVPFFDLSPKLMIRSRVNLDASKANLSCEIKRLFVV